MGLTACGTYQSRLVSHWCIFPVHGGMHGTFKLLLTTYELIGITFMRSLEVLNQSSLKKLGLGLKCGFIRYIFMLLGSILSEASFYLSKLLLTIYVCIFVKIIFSLHPIRWILWLLYLHMALDFTCTQKMFCFTRLKYSCSEISFWSFFVSKSKLRSVSPLYVSS